MKKKVKAGKSTLFLCLAVLCIYPVCARSQATQLWPAEVGTWRQFSKSDVSNTSIVWTVTMNVLEQVTLNGKQYFHVRELNYSGPGDDSDFYMRSTDTQIWMYTPSGEFLAFETGPVGTSWTYPNPNDNGASTIHKRIVDIVQLTVPYGGPYTAYEYEHHAEYQNGSSSASCYEYVVPGLGYVQERDEWGENTLSVMTGTGTDPLLQDSSYSGNGWEFSSWFGAYGTDPAPLVYHQTLGWLYPFGTSTDNIWFWDPQWDGSGGWWWTSSSVYPWVYSATEGEWLYYDATDSSPGARWFFTGGGQASTH